ncbi:MAG: endo-1,4-beta-xylanase [Bacteroidaceae bacterium]|nr:endo-1,4-beta-xylanase [Bacteroidaceae bacterium]
MKKLIRNGLLMLAAGALVVSCADYNVTDDFKAEKDPTYQEPYKDLDPVKSYIDRITYPNLTLGAMLNVSDFNKQELAHAAAVTNFDNLAFGTTLMSGAIVNGKGVMNFLEMKDLLDHVEEIGGEVFGSPLFANSNQADDWLKTLTAPIEIMVDFVEGKTVDFTTMTTFEGTVEKGTAEIVDYDGAKALKIGSSSQVRIVEGFEVDSLATYTATFWAKADKNASFTATFSGNKLDGGGANGTFILTGGEKWKKIVVQSKSAPGETEGYLRIEIGRGTSIHIQKVEIGYYPDNHRPQTEKEMTDTIHYAINAWCDGMMRINAGRITSFDLIDEAIGTKELENGMLDLKHSTDKFYWQDVLGSEQYAPLVSRVASTAFTEHGGDPAALKFFISESGLENTQKFESLKYWINVWDSNGAKIDGINAKVNLVYSEDPATQEANKTSIDNMLTNLATVGKLIRLSNFDIKYQDAEGANVAAKDITDEQRQKLADYYGYVIKSYMDKIPNDKQAGICKGNLSDTSDPVGLWAIDSNSRDWVRTATYKAFCDALSGK